MITGTSLADILADPTAGTAGSAATRVLLGGDVDSGSHSGVRSTLGYWLSEDQTIGLEGSYFFLGKQSRTQTVSTSGDADSLILGTPFFDVLGATTADGAPGEAFLPFAGPGGVAGFAALASSQRLQGAEANVVLNVIRGDLRVDLLAGFRYLQLEEDLQLSFSFGPSGVAPVTVTDQFNTRNRFYGGQVGARAEYRTGILFVNASGKIALGNMNETADIAGALNNGAGTVVPGGFLAQATNSGRHTRDVFAVVPEVNANVGVAFANWGRVYVGYNFLFASSVSRPGDVINRNLNVTQVPGLGGDPAALVGPPEPAFRFNRSDFWAQGLNFGLEFRY